MPKSNPTGSLLTLEIQSDVIARLTKARPLDCLSELVWNSLDADANKVEIRTEFDSLDTLTKIIVEDDGDGFAREDALTHFNMYGGSWKAPGGFTKSGRPLHGSEGRGRFNAIALGRIADWDVVYQHSPGDHRQFRITVTSDDPKTAAVTDEKPTRAKTGVHLTISEPHKQYQVFDFEHSRAALLEVFARYLIDYRQVKILVDGNSLDAADAFLDTHKETLPDIAYEGTSYPAAVEVVEWREIDSRSLQLATEEGVPLHHVPTKFHVVGDFQFSAYLRSPLVSKLNQEGVLPLTADYAFNTAIDNARSFIKSVSRRRAAEHARNIVEQWKNENSYPFEGEPASPIEEMERQVFEIVAVTASEHIDGFEAGDAKTRTLHLRLLRSAIEKSPRELQIILSEVLKLPAKKQSELAELLRESNFESIVSAAKEVSDRWKTIQGIEQLVFTKDTKKRMKERSQLHRILNDNAWMFGNEYSLSVSDSSLTHALKAHKRMLGEEIAIDEPVKHVSQERGIIDLMFSRAIKSHRPGETEHLVVELKAPRVTLGKNDTQQIEGYAFTVATDERFRNAHTKWDFWLISNDMDDFVRIKAKQTQLPPGVIHQSSDPNITIWVKTWAQVFDENRARLKFFQDRLNSTADSGDAVRFVCNKYRHFLDGVVEEVGPSSEAMALAESDEQKQDE